VALDVARGWHVILAPVVRHEPDSPSASAFRPGMRCPPRRKNQGRRNDDLPRMNAGPDDGQLPATDSCYRIAPVMQIKGVLAALQEATDCCGPKAGNIDC